MAVTYPEIGNKVVAKVIGTQNKCTIGMKVGDEFDLGVHKCGEFCGEAIVKVQQASVSEGGESGEQRNEFPEKDTHRR